MSVYDQINAIQNDVNRINFERGQQNLGKTDLDKQAFFQLMMARLQSQNPLNPADDESFFNQQVQLASMEKLSNVADILQGNSQLSQAGTLVGKKVDLALPNNKVETGKIDSVTLANGVSTISVNGKTFDMKQVVKIYGDV